MSENHFFIEKRNPKSKGLFVLSRLLGGKTFVAQLVEIIGKFKDISPTFVYFDVEDYDKFPAPKFTRISDALEGLWVAKRKFYNINHLGSDAYDFLFVQSYGLILPLYPLILKYPVALAHDSTNVLSSQLMRLQITSLKSKIKHSLANGAQTPFYKMLLPHVDVFLPRTSWCAGSLMNNFHIPSDKITVTMPPIDLSIWKPLKKDGSADKCRILFVGNDFERKGGLFLLKVFKDYLSSRCSLTIISNDKDIMKYGDDPRIAIIRGLDHSKKAELIKIYQDSDLFLFPTRNEKLGIALCEAAAAGLPIIATDVGGTGDIVRNSVNGYLMQYNSSAEEWAAKINALIDDGPLRATFGANSRKLAEQLLDVSLFENIIRNTINKLLSIQKRSRD